MKFAVMGGDMRMISLAKMLEGAGHDVCTYALDAAPEGSVKLCGLSAAGAADGVDCVVLPLPVVRNEGGMLNAPMSAKSHDAAALLRELPKGTLVCAGKPDKALFEVAEDAGIKLVDYYAREELVALNALATAEGAISVMLRSSPITIWESKVLVIGAGRIGKMLARRLRALGAYVSVSARKPWDKAYIREMGCTALDTGSLGNELGDFDTVINTVPAMVLDAERLEMLKPDVLLLDLASRPGGIDFDRARELKLKVIWAQGLPAETAPVAAGKIIMETVFNIIKEHRG